MLRLFCQAPVSAAAASVHGMNAVFTGEASGRLRRGGHLRPRGQHGKSARRKCGRKEEPRTERTYAVALIGVVCNLAPSSPET